MSKALHAGFRRREFLDAARLHVRTYLAKLDGVAWHEALQPRAVRHTLGCLLARVAGRSPLEYLTPAERQAQLRIALGWISHPPLGLCDWIDAFSEDLECR